MPKLDLFLFGPPRIEFDGVPVHIDTRKATALVAYLVVTGQPHSRDTLAALLWPDADTAHARAALRRTLSPLNKALAGGWLDAERETITLKPDQSLWSDVTIFRHHLDACRTHGHPPTDTCPDCIASLSAAIRLYQGDFLSGFTLRDSPQFDDWQFQQAENLRRDFGKALEQLVSCYVGQADFENAISYTQRWLALDALYEPAHRTLMQLYAWTGQRTLALRQYRECVRVLDRELGVAPLHDTTQLYEAVRENTTPPPPVTPPTPQTSASPSIAPAPPLTESPSLQSTKRGTIPLVGRDDERAALSRAYAATATAGRLVVLEGETGIGKTRLAEDFLDDARADGSVGLSARCFEGESALTYGLFVGVLRAAVRRLQEANRLGDIPPHLLAETARLVPELSTLRPDLPLPPPLDNPGAQSQFFEGASQVIFAACQSNQSGILLLEDLHWCDEASLDLLSYIARRLKDHPLCLVLTWRNDEVPGGHRLRQLLTEAQRDGISTHLPLARLDEDAVAQLVAATRDTAATPALLGNLFRRTRGLPFFLIEYLEAIASGSDLADDAQGAMPNSVRGLLESRLATVNEANWQLLNTVAVFGRSTDFDALRDASGRSDEETVAALEELIERSLLEEQRAEGQSDVTYNFTHDQLRALVYEKTTEARRRLLHRRVAATLVAQTRGYRSPGELAGQIANHFRLAGQDAEAVDYFERAADHARSLYANAEALAHYRSALALGSPHPAPLHTAIGDLLTLQGDYQEALTSYETAAALADPTLLSAIERKLGGVYQRRGEWDLAESHFQAAISTADEAGTAGERARLYADWSLTVHNQGRTAQALDLARQALDLAESESDDPAVAQAHNILGVLIKSQGDMATARNHLERSLAVAETLNDPTARVAALNNLSLVYSAVGDIESAIDMAQTALDLSASQGDRHREAAIHNNLADLLHALGRSDDALEHVKQAVTTFAEIGIDADTLQPEIWKLVEW